MVNLNNLLAAAMMIVAEYKKGRDKVIAAGDPTDPNTGAVKTDQELIALFKGDAVAVVKRIDGLLAKHGGGE